MTVYRHRRRRSSRGQRLLFIALILTIAMMIVEIIAAILSGSLSLTADAGHMLTDAVALALSLFAAWFSTRPATPEKTYGYYRTEILAALANGLILWIIVIWISMRAFDRLQHPAEVVSGLMMIVATIGLAVNLFIGWMLSKERSSSLNIEGAWLNVMSDALGSVGVIVAGFLIHRFGWMAADPIASLIIAVLIAVNSWNLIKQSVNILLEGTPGHLKIREVIQALSEVPGVSEIHDIHLWTITTGMDAMSGHIIVEDLTKSDATLAALNVKLSEQFGIKHTTLQLESQRKSQDLDSSSA